MGLNLCEWCDHKASTIGTIEKGSTVDQVAGLAFRYDVHVSSEPGNVTGFGGSALPTGIFVCWCGVAGSGNNYVSVYGTFATQGDYTFYINSNSGNPLIVFKVSPRPTPVVTNTPPSARKGESYSHTVTIGPGNSAPINNAAISINSGFPFQGLAASGGTISGTPNFQSIGHQFNILVTCDGNTTGTNTVQSIVIKEALPFILFNGVSGIINVPGIYEFVMKVGEFSSLVVSAPDIAFPPPTGFPTASAASYMTVTPMTEYQVIQGVTISSFDIASRSITISGTPTGLVQLVDDGPFVQLSCSDPTLGFSINAYNSHNEAYARGVRIRILDQRQPVMPGGNLGKIYIDESASFSLKGNQGCPTTFSGTLLPPGMTVTTYNDGSGPSALLSGTPTGTPGIYDSSAIVSPFHHPSLRITGTNSVNRSGTGLYDIIVGYRQSVFTNPDPDDPCTLNLEWVNGVAGFSFDCEATNTPQTFTADAFVTPAAPAVAGFGTTTTGLPTGLSINASTGVISGTPSIAANLLPMTSTVSLTVDNFGAYGAVPSDPVGTAKITITLVATAAEITPVITSTLVPRMAAPNDVASGIRGIAMTYQITGSHCPTSYNAISLPPGLTVNTTTGLISGTPAAVGFFDTTIEATNVWGTGYAVVDFIISYPAPVITSPLFTFGVAGEVFDPPVSLGGGIPAGYHITASVADPSDIPVGGLVFNAIDTLVDALIVDQVTGIISGTIDIEAPRGANTVNIFATNADAHFDVGEGAFVPALPAPVSDLTINVYSSPPVITAVTPDATVSTGGATMTITGSGFLPGAIVCFGHFTFTCATPTAVSNSSITVTIPALEVDDDPYDIVVQNPDGQVGIFTGGLLVTAPGVSSAPIIRFTSLYSEALPIYTIINTGGKTKRKRRIFGMGTNVEILFYSGIDAPNNRLLNVHRKQLGTTSTRHGPGDLVFKGISSIQLSPFMYKVPSAKKIAHIDCVLRSDGTIQMRTREVNSLSFTDDTDMAYAAYQAILIKGLNQIPLPKIGTEECS